MQTSGTCPPLSDGVRKTLTTPAPKGLPKAPTFTGAPKVKAPAKKAPAPMTRKRR